MKPMSDRKMPMRGGKPESFFPEEAEHKPMKRPGDIKEMKYPDTEEATTRDQEETIRGISRNMPKPNFRH